MVILPDPSLDASHSDSAIMYGFGESREVDESGEGGGRDRRKRGRNPIRDHCVTVVESEIETQRMTS
jgi:hypothetical protein